MEYSRLDVLLLLKGTKNTEERRTVGISIFASMTAFIFI